MQCQRDLRLVVLFATCLGMFLWMPNPVSLALLGFVFLVGSPGISTSTILIHDLHRVNASTINDEHNLPFAKARGGVCNPQNKHTTKRRLFQSAVRFMIRSSI